MAWVKVRKSPPDWIPGWLVIDDYNLEHFTKRTWEEALQAALWRADTIAAELDYGYDTELDETETK